MSDLVPEVMTRRPWLDLNQFSSLREQLFRRCASGGTVICRDPLLLEDGALITLEDD